MSFNLDLSLVKENEKKTLPEGKYNVACTQAEVKDTKSGTGQYISAELTITDGEYKSRKIFQSFNIKNDNPKATEIGLQQLKSFLTKAKHPNPNALGSMEELSGLKCGVAVKIKSDEQWGDKAVVSYFTDLLPVSEKANEQLPF